MIIKEGHGEIRIYGMHNSQVDLDGSMSKVPALSSCHLRHSINTGAWLLMPTSTVNGKKLGDH